MTRYFTAAMELKNTLFPNKKQVLLTVDIDECPVNPIEDYWDSAYPVLALDNGHYSLGTKNGTAEAFRRIMTYARSIGKENDNCFDEYIYQHYYNPTDDDDANGEGEFTIPITGEMYHKLEYNDDIPGVVWYDEQDNPDYLGDEDIENLGKYAKKFECLYAPVYMYEHSGITLSLTEFSCPWDSGQLGWIVWDRLSRCRWHNWPTDHVFTEAEDKADWATMIGLIRTYNYYVEVNVWIVSLYEDASDVLAEFRQSLSEFEDIDDLNECDVSQLHYIKSSCKISDNCGDYYGTADEAAQDYVDSMGLDNLVEVGDDYN